MVRLYISRIHRLCADGRVGRSGYTGFRYIQSLVSGYKSKRISWLALSSNSDWESNASNTCKMGTFSRLVMLKICRIWDMFFEAADISFCSGLRVCSPPRSFPPLCSSHRAAEAFTFGLNVLRCLRTHREYASRLIQVIDGVRTLTPLDPQPCRLLILLNMSAFPGRTPYRKCNPGAHTFEISDFQERN